MGWKVGKMHCIQVKHYEKINYYKWHSVVQSQICIDIIIDYRNYFNNIE